MRWLGLEGAFGVHCRLGKVGLAKRVPGQRGIGECVPGVLREDFIEQRSGLFAMPFGCLEVSGKPRFFLTAPVREREFGLRIDEFGLDFQGLFQ